MIPLFLWHHSDKIPFVDTVLIGIYTGWRPQELSILRLEDIDLEAKSETRKMVEKFVDENPEAAASLLRNWLNEDWA